MVPRSSFTIASAKIGEAIARRLADEEGRTLVPPFGRSGGDCWSGHDWAFELAAQN